MQNRKVFTIKTVAGPQVVTAEMVGQLAIHPTLTADSGGVTLRRWTVSMPCGVAVGHFCYKHFAQDAADFLTSLGIDWSLPPEKLELDHKGLAHILIDDFGMRNGTHHYSDY